jgi:hypothetical protein
MDDLNGVLPKEEWKPQNLRDQWQKCQWLIEASIADNDREFTNFYKDLKKQIEYKMTPEQFSLMADDFTEVPHMYDAVLAKVKKQEAIDD